MGKMKDNKDTKESEQQTSDTISYCIHSVGKRKLIVVAASLAGLFSPLSASIYYPALPVIARDLQVSNTKINLSITTYLVVQGIAPMTTASFSDSVGRKPAYALCFTLFMAANLGLGLQNRMSLSI